MIDTTFFQVQIEYTSPFWRWTPDSEARIVTRTGAATTRIQFWKRNAFEFECNYGMKKQRFYHHSRPVIPQLTSIIQAPNWYIAQSPKNSAPSRSPLWSKGYSQRAIKGYSEFGVSISSSLTSVVLWKLSLNQGHCMVKQRPCLYFYSSVIAQRNLWKSKKL